MKGKSILAIGLFAFVCVSVIFLMAKEAKNRNPAEDLNIKSSNTGVEISEKTTID